MKEFLWSLITHTSNHIKFPTSSLGIIAVNSLIGRKEKSRNGKSIEDHTCYKSEHKKKHQNKSTHFLQNTFAWSRNIFPAVKILICILGLLFQWCCLFSCRISHPKPPWAPQSCLLQFQLIWTELGWSMTSPSISVLPCFWGWWHRERRAQEISSFLCQSSSFSGCWQCSGKENPKENTEVWSGGTRRARRWSRDTSTPVPVCGTHTHPSPVGLQV